MTKKLLMMSLVAVFAGCATTPPEQDPVVQRLTEMDSRLLRLERVLTNQSLLDLSQRISQQSGGPLGQEGQDAGGFRPECRSMVRSRRRPGCRWRWQRLRPRPAGGAQQGGDVQ